MKKVVIKCVILVAALLGTSAHADRQLPNQVDLLASYCSAVIQKRLQNWESVGKGEPLVESFLETMKMEQLSNLKRLRNYLMPRTPYLEVEGLLMAFKSGTDDVGLAGQESSFCLKTNPVCVTEGRLSNSCATQCIAGTVASRTLRCNSTNFLPQ